MSENTLHALVAALDATSPHVVLARTFTGPDVITECPFWQADLGPWEVGEANHTPNGLGAIIRLFWLLVVPRFHAQACEVVVEHCRRCIILPFDQFVQQGAARIGHGQGWIVRDSVSAKTHGRGSLLQSAGNPFGLLQPVQVLHAREDGIDTILLHADRVGCVCLSDGFQSCGDCRRGRQMNAIPEEEGDEKW